MSPYRLASRGGSSSVPLAWSPSPASPTPTAIATDYDCQDEPPAPHDPRPREPWRERPGGPQHDGPQRHDVGDGAVELALSHHGDQHQAAKAPAQAP